MKKEYLYVVIAGILSGLIIFGGKALADAGLSLYQISILPLLFTALLLPFILFKKECRIKAKMLKVFVPYGIIGTLTALAEFSPVILGVPVAIVVLLFYAQPLWTVLLSRIFLKEKITRNKIIAMILVIAGVIVLVNPFNITHAGNVIGVIIAILGGVCLSGWVIFGRVSGIKEYHPITTQFGCVLFTLIFLAISYPIISIFIKDPSITAFTFSLPANIWLYLLLFAVFANIAPHLFYFAGVRKVPASDAGIILLLEPVSAAILATVFLSQPITTYILIGGALILLGNYVVIRKGNKQTI